MKGNSKSLKNMKNKSVIASVLISCIIFLVFIGILEIVLRTTHLFRAKTSYIQPDPILGYRFIPGHKYWHLKENDHPVSDKINSFGWRDKEWSLKKSPNTYRVAVLGDSMVESADIESDRTFLALTEHQLNENFNSNVKVELMNFGFSNITQSEELLTLENHVVKFLPDMVLLFFFPVNDIAEVAMDTSPCQKQPFYQISENGELILDTSFSKTAHYKIKCFINLFKRHSALITFIGERYHGYLEQRRNVSYKNGKETIPKYLSLCTTSPDATFRKNYQLNKILIKAMAKYCKEKKILFMLVTVDIPNIYTPEGERKYKTIDSTFDAYFFENDLENYATSLNIEYLGLQRIFRQAYEKNSVPLHWFHWNYEGHKVIANALAEKLKPILASNKHEW